MNILFITLAWPVSGESNLYSELVQEFSDNGHKPSVITIYNNKKSFLTKEGDIDILHVGSSAIQKTNKYLKVIRSFLLGPKILINVRKFFSTNSFDLIVFATPPITISPSVVFLKKRFNAKLYLLLKDIWPHDAVDLNEVRKGGIIWYVFRYLEKMTYRNSDYLGCMSPANVEYILQNNDYIQKNKIEVCPNSLRLTKSTNNDVEQVRLKYDLPKNKTIFIYGGNIGKAQGIEFLIDIISYYKNDTRSFFLIIGSGTHFNYLLHELDGFHNTRVLRGLPRNEYDKILKACDVGLILLHPNSTVPNFPSRMLSYLIAEKPIIAAVDKATDIGEIIEKSGCGFHLLNGDMIGFNNVYEKIIISKETRIKMGKNGYELFENKYTTNHSYSIIMNHFEDKL